MDAPDPVPAAADGVCATNPAIATGGPDAARGRGLAGRQKRRCPGPESPQGNKPPKSRVSASENARKGPNR